MVLSPLTFWELCGCSSAASWALLMQHICPCVDTLPFLAVELLFQLGWLSVTVQAAATCRNVFCDSELAAQGALAPAAGSGI